MRGQIFTGFSSDKPGRVGHKLRTDPKEVRLCDARDMDQRLVSKPLEIGSPRLRLVALTDELADRQLSDTRAFFADLGVEFEAAWPPSLAAKNLLSKMRDRLADHPEDQGWYQWVYISPVMNRLVGLGGFTGPPDAQGQVEIGYTMLTSFREQGLATEGVTALMDWAYGDPRVKTILARTPLDNLAAQRVLEKAEFKLQDVSDAHIDAGGQQRFEHKRPAA